MRMYEQTARRTLVVEEPLVRVIMIVLLILALGNTASSQQQANRIQGPVDADIPMPLPSGHRIDYRDPAALAEITAYTQATVHSSWTGMKGTGTITLSGANETDPAILSMLPGNRARLEILASKGSHLMTISGLEGHAQYAGSKAKGLSPQTAAAGIVPFDFPISATRFPAQYALTDQGMVTIDGAPAHRITIESKIAVAGILPEESQYLVMDFYFDPQTHLLRKSAALVSFPGEQRQKLLRVITYGDYQASGPEIVPFSYSESLNGQPTWSLQLTAVDVVNLPSPEIF